VCLRAPQNTPGVFSPSGTLSGLGKGMLSRERERLAQGAVASVPVPVSHPSAAQKGPLTSCAWPGPLPPFSQAQAWAKGHGGA